MSKNILNYVFMGFSKNKSAKSKKIKELENEERAKAFDQAFSDKTYSVAKKVLDNVEKVADYDYDALFDRVNKVIDDKMPKMTRTLTPEERAKRSQEFDSKIENKVNKFSIDDYLNNQGNYKNSIIEKTKKNIQKKYVEADKRRINKSPQNTIDLSSNNLKESLNQSNDIELEIATSNKNKNDSCDDKFTTVSIEEKPIINEANINQPITDGKVVVEPVVHEALVEGPIILEPKIVEADLNLESEVHEALVEEPDVLEITATKENIILEPQNQEVHVVESTISETSINDSEAQVAELAVDESNKTNELESKKSIVRESTIDEIQSEVDVSENISIKESNLDEPVKVDNTDESKVKDKKKYFYTKDEIHKNKKYYKSRKKLKFGKQMKIELEDSIIGQQRKSFKRLFRFSLSFKLSFVFMVLIILTVVSLSIAFYLGIDYVLVLQEQGKIEDIQFFRDVLIVLLIIFDMAAILICVSFGTKASRGLVSPINEMTQIVQEINANDMDRRLNVTGIHDELKELATTFNEMLDRIENSYETQNRFTSDASHELRTPIAVIQGYINMLDRWGKADGAILDESIEAIKSESKNMKRLTEKLLLLAKADKGILELEFKPFALNELLDEITRETLMIDTNHTVTSRINEVKTITADRESLKQAIRIFVDNAVKYTPEGGTVYINSFIMKNKIFIEIEDNGIGISKEDMTNIFNRFYRVDKSRAKESGGHGLGLSIAKWIVNQHQGELEVKSELNKGTIITLILSPIKE